MLTHIAPSATDWIDRERVEIDRLRALCDGIPAWELECGHTDAGDPWVVIYDQQDDLTVIHIARIGGRYLVVRPQEGWSDSKATIKAAVDISLAHARGLLTGGGSPATTA
jgi:hypothetical protein